MISVIKEYIQSHPMVSLQELVSVFEIDIYTLRKILNKWQEHGKLSCSMPTQICCQTKKGCNTCNLLALEYYTWVNKSA